ncbi:MAG: hypothetical protein AAF633_02745 [Chloroflexota bacterium]
MLDAIEYYTRENLFDVLIGVAILVVVAPAAILISIRLVISGLSDARSRLSLLAISLIILLASMFLFDTVRRYLINSISVEGLLFVLIILGLAAIVGSGLMRVTDD